MVFNPFTEEHELFRQQVRNFAEKELAPHADAWEEAELFPNEVQVSASGPVPMFATRVVCGAPSCHYWDCPAGTATGGSCRLCSVQTARWCR